jgi:signal transduction histidine kinase
MSEIVGETTVGDTGGDALQSLREQVLRASLNVLAVAVPGISLVIIAVGLMSGKFDPMTMGLSAYTLTFPLLRLLHSRLGFRRSAIALLVLLATTGFVVEARGGVAIGNILLNAMVLLLGALFFGRRGAAAGFLVVFVLFVLAGFLVVTGRVPRITPDMWDSTRASFWLRQSIALALMGLAIAVAQVYVVERLATEATRLATLVKHEQQQRLALESSEREREHEREQRMRAQTALEESRRIEALARLAGGVAHDFNNSLTVIMGSAEQIRFARSLPEATNCVEEIVAAARQAAELTRQLLTLGRRQVSKPQPVPIAALFERLQIAFRRILPDDVTLGVEVPKEDIVARLDPNDLERSLLNLVLNARDAMPSGGRISLRCAGKTIEGNVAGLAQGRYVEISISDTGHGMEQETLDHIFEPFFTTKSAGAGSGLGLATVHAFAKDSGGNLTVDSTVGVGTTFTMLFPESADGGFQPEAAILPLLASGAVPAEARVLVVEDNPEVRDSMVRILSRGGFRVSQAANGDQAAAFIDEEFSLLCIDGVMPGLPARAVIAQIEQRWPGTRILLCSGYLQEDLLRRGVAAGRYAFLQKPFTSDELLATARGLTSVPG